MGRGPVLEQVNILPGAEGEVSIDQGYGELCLGKRRSDMRGHVVVTFRRVAVERIAVGDDAVQKGIQVGQHIGVGVFLYHERRRGVTDEHREQSGGHALPLRPGDDFGVDIHQSPPPGLYGYFMCCLLHIPPA